MMCICTSDGDANLTLFSYRQGAKDKKTGKDKRIFRPTIVTDDSGTMGEDIIYTKSTTVVRDPSKFRKIVDELPPTDGEVKFHNSNIGTKTRVLMRVAESDVDIYSRTYKAKDLKISNTPQRKIFYLRHTSELMDQALTSKMNKVIDMMFDNDMIAKDEQEPFVKMCIDMAKEHGKEVYWVEMVDSQSSPLVRIQDFVVGTIQRHNMTIEDEDDESHGLYKIIEPKIVK